MGVGTRVLGGGPSTAGAAGFAFNADEALIFSSRFFTGGAPVPVGSLSLFAAIGSCGAATTAGGMGAAAAGTMPGAAGAPACAGAACALFFFILSFKPIAHCTRLHNALAGQYIFAHMAILSGPAHCTYNDLNCLLFLVRVNTAHSLAATQILSLLVTARGSYLSRTYAVFALAILTF